MDSSSVLGSANKHMLPTVAVRISTHSLSAHWQHVPSLGPCRPRLQHSSRVPGAEKRMPRADAPITLTHIPPSSTRDRRPMRRRDHSGDRRGNWPILAITAPAILLPAGQLFRASDASWILDDKRRRAQCPHRLKPGVKAQKSAPRAN